ncbi:MAG: SPFH domain-containing protein [Firmicutes bacterium]|nr:SPFH domain-containing protein [Bacillota bacterium]MCM1400376.1 SPFH domain-containing protein [Bacteroides sp.]MCM1477133.1 SPFH domain-containing protein [Bacteroides sp.]
MNTTDHNDREYEYSGSLINGFAMLFFTFILIPCLIVGCIVAGGEENLWLSAGCTAVFAIIFFLGCVGYFTQEPNEARVMIFFGKYKGTCRRVGYFWMNPFMTRRKLSLRLRNMDIEPIKVNDKVGNPVLIGMVLVWRIKDTYRAVFDIDSASLGATGTQVSNAALERFVRIQSDAALREVTGHYAYDQTGVDEQELTLRDGGSEINELLEQKINDRLSMAGMEVVEARLNYLAYAPEIAAVMLRRQQASAIISAREKIVEGAVTMVDMALKRLEQDNVVKLDNDRKAAMVSNLLVVLCADEPAQAVVNTGQ